MSNPSASPIEDTAPMNSVRYPVGVLYVHGIGQQAKDESITELADALYGCIRSRIVGIGAGHSHRHTTRESLKRAAPQAAHDPGSHAPRRAQRQYLGFLQTAHNYVPEAALVAENLVELPGIDGEPLLASVELSEAPLDGKPPSAFSLEIDWTDAEGRQHASDWLIAEAWWADKCRPPSVWQLLAWATQALPGIIAAHLFSRLQDEPSRSTARNVLYSVAAVLAAVFFLPIVYLFIIVSGAGSFLPWSWLSSKARDIRLLLTGVVGDAFIFAGSKSQRAAILDRIQSELKRLSDRCESVVIVGHSQGAMLAYLACLQRPSNVRTLITLGSGIVKLRALMTAFNADDPLQHFGKNLLLSANLVGAGVWLATVLGLAGLISGPTALYAALLALAAAVGAGLCAFSLFTSRTLRVPPEDLVWDRWMQLGAVSLDAIDPDHLALIIATGEVPGAMRWFDLIATHDLVAGRRALVRTPFRYDASAAEPVGDWPRSLSVTNCRSILFDHTSYLQNREECIAFIIAECVELTGDNSARWLAPDTRRARLWLDERGRRRRRSRVPALISSSGVHGRSLYSP